MASPVADSYAVGSGITVYGGRYPPAPPATVSFFGNSLTEPASYNLTPWYWALGVAGGVLAPVINAGVSGNTVADMLARVDNAYTDASPGLASPPEPVGWAFGRFPTNSARAGAINDTIRGQIDALVAKMLTHASKAVLFAIPPLGGAEAAANANVPGYNAYLASKSNGTTVFYIDGTANLKDGGGAQIGSYFSDGIHFNSAGVYRAGIDEGAALASLLAGYGYASPVDAAAAAGSTQWHPNPLNAGTGGTIGTGFTGTLPNGYAIARNGATHAATCSVVAAAGGDANNTPWARVDITALGASGSIRLSFTAAGRSITPSDPAVLDVCVQLRFNALDTTNIAGIRTWMQDGSGGRVYTAGGATSYLELKTGAATVDRTVVLRSKIQRPSANTSAGATIYFDILAAGAASGAIGSVDIRCFTIKG